MPGIPSGRSGAAVRAERPMLGVLPTLSVPLHGLFHSEEDLAFSPQRGSKARGPRRQGQGPFPRRLSPPVKVSQVAGLPGA